MYAYIYGGHDLRDFFGGDRNQESRSQCLFFWGKFPQPGKFISNYPEVVLYFGQLAEITYFLWNLLKVIRLFALFEPRLPAV